MLPPTPTSASYRRSYDSDDDVVSPAQLAAEREHQRVDMQRRMHSAAGSIIYAQRDLDRPIAAYTAPGMLSYRSSVGVGGTARVDLPAGSVRLQPTATAAVAQALLSPNAAHQRSMPPSALSTQRTSRTGDSAPMSVRFREENEVHVVDDRADRPPDAYEPSPPTGWTPHEQYSAAAAAPVQFSPKVLAYNSVSPSHLQAMTADSGVPPSIGQQPNRSALQQPISSSATTVPHPPRSTSQSSMQLARQIALPVPSTDPLRMLEDWHAANPSAVSTARPFLDEEVTAGVAADEMPMTSRAIAHDRSTAASTARSFLSPDVSEYPTARSLNTLVSPKSFRSLELDAQLSTRRSARGRPPIILALPAQLENAPPAYQTEAMLHTLSDGDFRRVMERWIAMQTRMHQEEQQESMPLDADPAAVALVASPLHTSLLESYLSFHPWSYAPPAMLRALFGFLTVPDLVLGVKGVCQQWRTVVSDRTHAWTKDQAMVWPEHKQVSNSQLLLALGSVPSLRAIRFEAQAGLAFANAVRHVATLLPTLHSLQFDRCPTLRVDDLDPLLLPLPAASTSLELPATSAALQELSLDRCLAVDLQLMDLLGSLPHLHTLRIESLQPLTASRAHGLHLLSASRMPHQRTTPPPPTTMTTTLLTMPLFPQLTALDLAPLSSDACLTHIVPRTQLQVLKIRGCISNIGIESLCIMQHLTTLHVCCTYQLPSASGLPAPSMSADEMAGICDGSGFSALDQLSALTELHASVAALSPAGFAAICTIKSIQRLTINTRAMTTIPPTSTASQSLGASSSSLAGVSTLLSQFHVLPRLTHLDLSGCAWITDEQVSFLTHPLICARLRELSLAGLDAISDVAAYWLSKLTKLRFLDLRGTGISSTGYREFYRPLEACIILRYTTQPPARREPMTIAAAAATKSEANPLEPTDGTAVAGGELPSADSPTHMNASVQTDAELVEEQPAVVVPVVEKVVCVDAEVLTYEQAISPTLLELSQSPPSTSAFYLKGNLCTVGVQTHDQDMFAVGCQTGDAIAAAFQARLDEANQAAERAADERQRELNKQHAEREMAKAQVLLTQLSDKMAQSQAQLVVMSTSAEESREAEERTADALAVNELDESTQAESHAKLAPSDSDSQARASDLAVDVPFSPIRSAMPTALVPPPVPSSPFHAHLTPNSHPSPTMRAKKTPPLRTRSMHSPTAAQPHGTFSEEDLLAESVLAAERHPASEEEEKYPPPTDADDVFAPLTDLQGSFFSATFTPRGLIDQIDQPNQTTSEDRQQATSATSPARQEEVDCTSSRVTTPIRLYKNGQLPYPGEGASPDQPFSPAEAHTPVSLHRRARTPKATTAR